MEEAKREQIVHVGSVVETLSADAAGDAPLYTLESLCTRCHQNVLITFACLFTFPCQRFFNYAILFIFCWFD